MINNTYVVYTLVDVSNEDKVTPKGTNSKYKQYQNYNSFLQALSLRTQITILKVNKTENEDLSSYNFGSNYKTETVWKIVFTTETQDVWKKQDDDFFHAHFDLHGVPIYNKLDETSAIGNSVDCLNDQTKNSYLEKYDIV